MTVLVQYCPNGEHSGKFQIGYDFFLNPFQNMKLMIFRCMSIRESTAFYV
jgi:hypothetical protein